MEIRTIILNKVDEFPTLPTIFSALSDVIANPHSTAADAAEVISQDQASAAKILKAANSSIYGFRGRINTVTQAIVFIGFEEVRNLIIAMSIIDIFKRTKGAEQLNPVDMWKHSIAVGVLTRLIGNQIGARNIENYFLAGILHDIGKLIFFKFIPDEYQKAVNYAIDNNVSAREAEAEVLGITHTVAGEILAEKWKLPLSIKEAVRYHTSGRVDGSMSKLVSSVHAANIAAVMLELGQAGEDTVPMPNLEVWNNLNLPDNFFTNNMNQIYNDFEISVKLMLKS